MTCLSLYDYCMYVSESCEQCVFTEGVIETSESTVSMLLSLCQISAVTRKWWGGNQSLLSLCYSKSIYMFKTNEKTSYIPWVTALNAFMSCVAVLKETAETRPSKMTSLGQNRETQHTMYCVCVCVCVWVCVCEEECFKEENKRREDEMITQRGKGFLSEL